MKRIILCVSILAVIVAGSFYSLVMIKNNNERLTASLDRMVEYEENKETGKALEEIQEFSRLWSKYYTKLSFLVQSSRLESISASAAKLRSLLSKDSEEFYSECETIRYSINLVYDNELPHLHSIF